MAQYGVDRYGRPMGMDQQANPYNDQKQNNPAAQRPDPNTQQQNPAAQQQGQFAAPQQQQPHPQPQQAPPPQQGGMWSGAMAMGQHLANTGVSGYAPGGQPAPQPQPQGTYAPIQGFDTAKLNGTRAYDSAAKYSDAVRAFSQGLGSGVQMSRNNLGGMTDYAHQHGFANAHAVGDDKIDFGDGNGPIDVIQSNGSIWFQNGPDRFGPQGGAPQGGPAGLAQMAAMGGSATPVNAGAPPAPQFQPPADSQYHPGQLPSAQLPAYQAANISQFQNPDQAQSNQLSTGLLNQMLQNPHSMSDQGVAQMKQKSMEDMMQMNKLQGDALMQKSASRGAMGGSIDAGQRRLATSLADQVMGSNRDIDIQKMQQDRADELGALGASNDVLGGQMSRATAGYGAGLTGQQAQATQNMAANDSKAQQVQFDLQRALSQEGLNSQGADSAFRNWQAQQGFGLQQQGLGIDQQRVSNQNSQFGLSNDLANRQFADDMNKWRAMLNFNYQSGAQNANQSMWQ